MAFNTFSLTVNCFQTSVFFSFSENLKHIMRLMVLWIETPARQKIHFWLSQPPPPLLPRTHHPFNPIPAIHFLTGLQIRCSYPKMLLWLFLNIFWRRFSIYQKVTSGCTVLVSRQSKKLNFLYFQFFSFASDAWKCPKFDFTVGGASWRARKRES